MSAQRFWFMRHGQTEANARGVRCGGDVDLDLTAQGKAEVLALAPTLRRLEIGVIVASPLLRTRHSAEILARELGGVPVVLEPLFRERALGEWNGLTIMETEARLQARHTPPGGESNDDFIARIARAADTLRPLLRSRPLLISSKGVARALRAVLGLPAAPPMQTAELVEMRFDQREQDAPE